MHDYQGPGRSKAYARRAMCSTSHPLAAQAALETLDKGGNAVDAAVAGALVLGICEPMMCGLGGDVFAMIHLPGTDSLIGINGSGRAPKDLDAEILRDQGLSAVPLDSVHSVTMPGAIDAFDRMVRDWGLLDLSEVVQPAIREAEAGVPVCHRSAIDWATFGKRLQGPGCRHFLNGNRPYVSGTIFASPTQAEALRLIADGGRDAFYHGPIMEDMLVTLKAMGGLHSEEDFAEVEAEYVEPMSVDYRGHQLFELPPNGQGVTALLLAKILERFDLSNLDPHGARRVHLEAEATRLAYGARDQLLGDPARRQLHIDHLLSDHAVSALAELIDPERMTPHIIEKSEPVHRDTVYICVTDENRIAVSLIYSTFWPFGSGIASERFGISLQNRGAGFNLREGHVNELKGGRRPLHTLIPGFLKKPGEYTMPFGVMGGPYQATGHVHFLCNLVDYGMDLQEAIDAPRSFADPANCSIQLETRYHQAVADELQGFGHTVEWAKIGMGGAQAIMHELEGDLLIGGSDPRKDGLALGR